MSLLLFVVAGAALFFALYLYLRYHRRVSAVEKKKSDLAEVAELFRIKPLSENDIRPLRSASGFIFVDGKWEARDFDKSAAMTQLDDASCEIRVLSLNVWFEQHKQKERLARLQSELRRLNVDVVCLQEVTSPVLTSLLEDEFVQNTYVVSASAQKVGYGVVMLVSQTLIERSDCKGFCGIELPSRMGRTCVAFALHSFIVATSHLESLRSPKERKLQFDNVVNSIRSFSNALFLGDMNCDAKWNEPLEDALDASEFTDVWEELKDEHVPGNTQQKGNKRIDRAFSNNITKVRDMQVMFRDIIVDENCEYCFQKLKQCQMSDHFGILVTLVIP